MERLIEESRYVSSGTFNSTKATQLLGVPEGILEPLSENLEILSKLEDDRT